MRHGVGQRGRWGRGLNGRWGRVNAVNVKRKRVGRDRD